MLSQNLKRWCPPQKKLVSTLSPHLAAHHVVKFCELLPLALKLYRLIHYILSQFLTTLCKKIVRKNPIPGGVCASKIRPFSSACKNFAVQHPPGAEICSSEKGNLMSLIALLNLHGYKVFTRSSKLRATNVQHYGCWKFAGSCKHPISKSKFTNLFRQKREEMVLIK